MYSEFCISTSLHALRTSPPTAKGALLKSSLRTNAARKVCLVLLVPLFLIGCSTNFADETFSPVVLDDARMLDKATADWLNSYSYPRGLAFVVRSVDKLPIRDVGSQADELFEKDALKCPKPDACKARGVYLLISREPSLIQVRVGSELARKAQWAGITAGKPYIDKQLPATQGRFDEAVREAVAWLSDSLPVASNESWIRRLISLELTNSLYFELDQLSHPSETVYGNYILKPFVQARAFESQFSGTWWFTYLLASSLALALRGIITSAIWLAIGKASPQIASGMNLIVSILLNLFLAIPAAASILLMSGARLEDQLAVKASGISGIDSFVFAADSFAVKTGLLLGLIVVVVRILRGVADSSEVIAGATLPPEDQQIAFSQFKLRNPAGAWLMKGHATTESGTFDVAASETEFDKEPYSTMAAKSFIMSIKSGLKWGILAWVFLPRALSLVALCLWIIPILRGGLLFVLRKKGISRRRQWRAAT